MNVVALRRSAVSWVLLSTLLVPLASCANSGFGESLQDSLAADPRLRETAPETSPSPELAPEDQAELPTNFPAEIPRYPNAALQEVIPAGADETNPEVSTVWNSPDGSDRVFAFYREQLAANGWTLVEAPLTNDQGTLVAQRETPSASRVTVVIGPKTPLLPSPSPDATPSPDAAPSPSPSPNATTSSVVGGTQFTIRYTPAAQVGQTSPSPTTSPQQLEAFLGAEGASDSDPTATPSPSVSALTPNNYTDLNKAPQDLRPYVTDLAQLGVLSLSPSEKTKGGETNFLPNKPVSRREYARWLFATNNQLFRDRAAQQIRPANSESTPVFRDVPRTDPDFATIQGLAEAGIIPSSLSGSPTVVTFRPDAQLSRETMLLWKVPVDTRQPLPTATLNDIKQTWGFQDAARIDPQAQRAVLADFQNADLSNIRRVFGFTTLFQPKRPVTRAEAAASLWYFGYPGDGVSARDALKGQ